MGLQRPGQADPHLVLAVLAALPVWLVLFVWAPSGMRSPQGAWALCSLVLVQPCLEEWVFRGLLQGEALRLTMRHGEPACIGPVTWANALVTLAFVGLHLLVQPVEWALSVAVPSLVLGHLRERLHSVWPAVGVHVIYNAGFGLIAWAHLPN